MFFKTFVKISFLFSLLCSYTVSYADNTPKVLLKTSMGNIVLQLDHDKAPASVDNFLNYVNKGFYNGLVFHRVIKGFMIQGGGYNKDLEDKATDSAIKNEAKNGLKNDKYTIAMARTYQPNSATSQFFINTANNAMLNYPGQDGWGYAVFGKVIQGMDVVDKIESVKTQTKGMYQNVPVTPVVIESASVIQ